MAIVSIASIIIACLTAPVHASWWKSYFSPRLLLVAYVRYCLLC